VTLVARPGALTDIGLHRKTNEDTFVVAPPLFVVCDGMGGAQAGEVASGLAAETLAAAVADGQPLLAAAEQANAAVFQRASDDRDHAGMGTTLTAVVLSGDTGHFVHIGDSRAYLLRAGALEQLSDDHSLVGEMMRDGRLSEEEAVLHPHRSILSRALGTEALARIDEFEVDLQAGDVLLLCSDGLSGPVPADVIRKALGRADPEDAAAKLIAEARRLGGPDNITAVVLRLDEPPVAGEEVTLAVTADEALALAVLADEAATLAVPADEEVTLDVPADEAPTTLLVAPVSASDPQSAGAASAQAPARGALRRLGCSAVALALLVAVAFAGAVTLSTVFYVGVDDGRLAIYSGLPTEIGPLHLHAVYRRSSLPYESLGSAERRLVDERGLHTRSNIMALAEMLRMWP
jgi:serine/threonine protein phosphatase PrpC